MFSSWRSFFYVSGSKQKADNEALQGAGTYGIVREADGPEGKVAVKIILKKNVKGNEQMVYDELKLLQQLDHPHIVQFRDWFESRVSKNIPHPPCNAVLFRMKRVLICFSGADRINTTSLLNWRQVVNCLTVFVNMENLPRRMHPRLCARFCRLSITSTKLTLCTEVSLPSWPIL